MPTTETYRRRAWELAIGKYGYITTSDAHQLGIPVIELGVDGVTDELALRPVVAFEIRFPEFDGFEGVDGCQVDDLEFDRRR